MNPLAREFTCTLDGVSQSMHDEYDDAGASSVVVESGMALDRRESMCLSRAFSLSVNENDDRSVRSYFAVASSDSACIRA